MATSANHSSDSPLDVESVLAVLFALSLGPTAQLLASRFLPSNVSRKTYLLFVWHAYDALTHFLIEGSYLYHCFCSYITLPDMTSDYPHPASLSSPTPHFLNRADRRYGASYGSGPTARLWQEYAKADRRWGESDPTVISLEILTVGLAGPAALYICYLLSKLANDPSVISAAKRKEKTSTTKATATAPLTSTNKATISARMHFIMAMLATAELYGGFMTFAPEWLSGSTALETSNPIYLWLYLVFFNILWVFIPAWILYAVYGEIVDAYRKAAIVGDAEKKK